MISPFEDRFAVPFDTIRSATVGDGICGRVITQRRQAAVSRHSRSPKTVTTVGSWFAVGQTIGAGAFHFLNHEIRS